ncbi:DUF5686 and carboxypeptidase-like regulatory domain-containing protein [Dysgonomonas sp. 520]|uniref:DUF5686 and carboxypeptidase-like regulatory domain-containing protein n=1 Tax=Dysgonomonas sp. 520 TaxID=2302931 RepID=UPI0013D61992|nr:DUF5686 and carboxypeptidase-like regulatory domain-containing protein [Dysgonomonas sp. 520]NDW09768.1 carboxypeptidase-like regulatory domain-containing protein [Dysgonomonas sp. 520]
MSVKSNKSYIKKLIAAISLLLVIQSYSFSQTTTVQGVVKDSITGNIIEFAIVRFDDSAVGNISDEKGKFKISNNSKKNQVVVSLMGYKTWTKTVPIGKTTTLEVLLQPSEYQLDEVVIRPGKEKYSKKNNPAVELIKKVIENKERNNIRNQDYYQTDEYDRLIFAFNKVDTAKVKEKLAKYTMQSRIDNKTILPFSTRETLSTFYYRKKPESTKRIVTAHELNGIDEAMNVEAIDAVTKEMFKDINITDNKINLLLRDFVGPLSSSQAVDFYKWYIIDTVTIEQERYINLGFLPFNTRDIGFTGNIYVSNDSSYAVKRVTMDVPNKSNVNFVDAMVVEQDFEELSPNLWIPKTLTMSVDLTMANAIKLYVEKVKNYNNFVFNQPVDVVFVNPAPVLYVSGYNKQSREYWEENRPQSLNTDYKVDLMMDELMSNKYFKLFLGAVKIISSSSVPLSSDEEKNKFEVGKTLSLFSFNGLEGARFRLTGNTTPNFHKHLFLYGYGAYGTKDKKFKYYGEATWAFGNREKNKDEFPMTNLVVGHKYDANPLGLRFLQSERDDIFMSGKNQLKENATYSRTTQVEFKHETYKNFSFDIFARTQKEKPAGNLTFRLIDDNGNMFFKPNLISTEVGLSLRYAPNEKFFQQRRARRKIPHEGVVYSLSYTAGLKNVFGSDYNYHKLMASITKDFWMSPYGKLQINVIGEKIWGDAPFPILLTASANKSFTIQKHSFSLVNTLEFLNDQQITWNVTYNMDGWLLNRIPLLNMLKLREVFGLRGIWGSLSDRNNPEHNNKMLVFPNNSFKMKKDPYMEASVGLENILGFFRLDYVWRLNYLNHPNIDKSAIRLGFEMSF